MVMQYRQAERIVERRLAGEHLLVPLQQAGADLQKLYLLNETAAAVWSLLAEPRTLEQIVEALALEYEASEEVLRQDVGELLSDLLDRGFVVEAG